MRRGKFVRNAGIVVAATFICLAVFWVLSVSDVMGKFVPTEPYVTGKPESASVVVTSEGGTQKGTQGSKAKPCSSEVPTAEGMKGSETNPFVILEIVPEKEMQQFTYLSGNVDYGMPKNLDVLKIGIEMCEKDKRSFTDSDVKDNNYYIGNFSFDKVFGQWFSNYQYSVYKIGSKTEKESLPFVQLSNLYSIKLTDKDIEEVGIDIGEFDADYEANKGDIKKLFVKYPNLFEEDKDGKKIKDIAKKDSQNWDPDHKNVVLDEGEFETYEKKGFIVAVEPGKGDFGFASEQDCKDWVFTRTDTDADRWIYVEKEEDLPEGYKENSNNGGNAGMWTNGFFNNSTGLGWKELVQLYNYHDKDELTGVYMSLQQNWVSCKYYSKPKVTEDRYTFEYYGLRSNEILKRALFTFRDQEEYDNFHMKVICMTPAELNELAKKDTPETLDMIERADMYSFQSCGQDAEMVNDTKFFYEFYHERILGEDDYEFDKDKVVKFYENDLEWDLCTKIIMRESENRNLPLVYNQMVGEILGSGVTQSDEKETHMYVTEGIGNEGSSKNDSYKVDVPSKGSLNNISKLYLISLQFDLLARKAKAGMERTFMEDIFPYITKISLGSETEGAVKNTATTTGYYNRPLCGCPEDKWSQDKKERSYYLWNRFTFFPPGLRVHVNNAMNEKDVYVRQGYLPTYFNDNSNGNPFMIGELDSYRHQSGSDGNDEKNVTIISDHSNSNSNHSTLLGDNGDTGKLVSNFFDVVYQILNGQSDEVENLSVSVLKQKKLYVKMTDDIVLIDYNSDAKYDSDKELYLKVRVSNRNNEAGIITNVRLLSDKGEPITLDIAEAMNNNTVIKKENVYDSKGENPIHGYRVPENGSITFFIPYSLYDWQSGYKTVELVTKGRAYNEMRDRHVIGEAISHQIAISERTLFNLE